MTRKVETELTMKNLTVLINLVSGEKAKSLRNKEAAVERFIEVMNERLERDATDEAEDVLTSPGFDTATGKVHAIFDEAGIELKKPRKSRGAPKAKKEKASGEGDGRRGRRSSFAGMVIYPLQAENPRRKDSHGYRSYDILLKNRDGITFEEYIAAGGRRNDLDWDSKHNYVELRSK